MAKSLEQNGSLKSIQDPLMHSKSTAGASFLLSLEASVNSKFVSTPTIHRCSPIVKVTISRQNSSLTLIKTFVSFNQGTVLSSS